MPQLYRFRFPAMGSPCELQLYSKHYPQAKRAAKTAMADIRRLEARYSRYRENSILSAINRAAAQGKGITVDNETAILLDYAQTCYQESEGRFDISSGILRRVWDFNSKQLPSPSKIAPLLKKVGWDKVRWNKPHLEFTIPGMELDFGGLGKEYAADRAATLCVAQGIHHGLVDLGGDIKVIGPHPDSRPWQIGVRHPRQTNALMATLDLYQGGVASSGDYERYLEIDGQRYCHLLDSRTGWPVQGLSAVTVIAAHCLVAGSVSTIAMLKGVAGVHWLAELDLQSLWMDEKGKFGITFVKNTKLAY